MTTTSGTPRRWGASPEDWQRLIDLGLLADLLPVVSDPAARISATSKLKQIGKVPSRYVGNDEVAGIAHWTGRTTTEAQVAQWAREGNYGICLQTRRVRALDIDLDDPVDAAMIAAFVRERLAQHGIALPERFRGNSGKTLLAFELSDGAEPYTKRILRVDGGIVEFLATGQQFIAHGTHPSGARYEWRGLPEPLLGESFPLLDPDTFEALWDALVSEFGIAAPVTERASKRPTEARRDTDEVDPVRDWLHEHGWVRSVHHDGRLNITCPWEDEHSSDNETATQYFLRGTGGFALGHFRCLHAHCAHRTDDDFLREIGFVAGQFEEVTEQAVAELVAEDEVPTPVGMTRNQNGRVLARIGNLLTALRHPRWFGFEVRHDTFRDEIMVRATPTGVGDVVSVHGGWRPFTDADYVLLRAHLEQQRGFVPVSKELMRDVVLMVATENSFDSAQEWIATLPEWDGVERVPSFLHKMAGALDSHYTRSVSIYLWTALAGRVLDPGCQVDMVPILVGEQGLGKTSLVRSIVPAPDFFMEADLAVRDDALARVMRGKLIAEIPELRGLRSREIEAIKAFITRTHEQWVPKYREFATQYPRRLLFVGTTNETAFLADETGNRRWLPVRVTQFDLPALVEQRAQLWAEGVARWRQGGVQWRDAHESATEARDAHSVADEWGPAVSRWLADTCGGTVEAPAACAQGFTVSEVLVGALGFDLRHVKRQDEMRVSAVLRELGFERVRVMHDGHRHWRWRRA